MVPPLPLLLHLGTARGVCVFVCLCVCVCVCVCAHVFEYMHD